METVGAAGMRRRIAMRFAAAFALCAVQAWAQSALDLFLPRPVEVKTLSGAADAVALARVNERIGDVDGAPPATRDEAYRLTVSPGGVEIVAPGEKGMRHARTTLAQLKALSRGKTVPAAVIIDWPAMQWRGLLIDCGRNYVSLPLLLEVIDFLSRYKYNVFHWHLSDHHGWRLESKRYPQLQSMRAFARQPGRYYTQDEFKAVVSVAAVHGITIVPEGPDFI